MGRIGIVVLLFAAFASADVLPSLPLDDPDTDLLRRLEGRSGCELPSRRPWPGESVLACVDSLSASAGISARDRSRLAALRRRLAPADTGWGLLAWKDGDKYLRIDVGATAYDSASAERTGVGVDRADTIGRDVVAGLRVRPRVDLVLGPNLALWSRPLQLAEISPDDRYDKEFDARDGVYQTALMAGPGELSRARTTDWLEGAVEFRSAVGRASLGMEPVEWGVLPVEPLMLSGLTSPFPVAQITQSVGPVEGTLLFGEPIGASWSELHRIYAHRFTWTGSNFTAGLSEMVLSVDKPVQPLYLIPVFPFLMTQGPLGTPDNKQLDLDGSWRFCPDAELSAELFIDDLQNYLGFFSNGWGNKWGLALGAKFSDWTGSGSLDRLQATRVEPWTGVASSFIVPGEPTDVPVDFGVPLGWNAGPNSGELDWIHTQDLSETWSWTVSARALWKGTDSGSNIYDLNLRDSSGTWVVAHPTKTWLGGPLLCRQDLSLLAERRFPPRWRLTFGAGIGDLSIPGRPLRWIPSVRTGVSWNE